MKMSFEERLAVVQEAEGGKPIRQLSREHGLHGSKIIEWVRKYRKYGEEGLRKQPRFKATGEIRETLARLVLEKGVTLSRIVVERQVSRSAVENWIREARRNGYAALHKPARRSRQTERAMARPRKREPQTELDRLRAENLRLRAENALLKKLEALAGEQAPRVQPGWRKPSRG